MKITPFLISQFAGFIFGKEAFGTMKAAVEMIDRDDLPNEQKRDVAIELFKKMGGQLAGHMLNACLEIAVVWLRKKLGVA